jgi:hypothetical protein
MSLERFDAWRAQEPPPDFAERTVRRFLRQRRGGGWALRRWVALGAIAATTVAGAAWGYSAFRTRPPVVHAPPALDPPAPQPPRSMTVAAPPPPPADPPSPPPVVARPVHRAAVAPAAAPDAGRKVMVPRCACDNDVLCSCL